MATVKANVRKSLQACRALINARVEAVMIDMPTQSALNLLAGAEAGGVDHVAASGIPGLPQHALVTGSLGAVIKAFPVGLLHSLVARIPARVCLDEDTGLNSDGHVPVTAGLGHSFNIAGSTFALVDICIYAGQNAHRAIEEFAASSPDMASPVEDLKAEAARVLGPRMSPSGYVAPWLDFFGRPWVPAAASEAAGDVGTSRGNVSAKPGIAAFPTAEDVPEEGYQQLIPDFHALPPRWSTSGAGPESADLLGGKPPSRGAPLSSMAEDADEGGDGPGTPTAAEPIKTGWSSFHFVLPGGAHPLALTVFSRGAAGDNMFHLLLSGLGAAAGSDGHRVARYLVDLFGPRLANAPYQCRLEQADRPGTHEGQTPVHMAILAGDAPLLAFLLDRGANARARCTGRFFAEGQHAYYGELPGSFAVCTGQAEMVRHIFSHEALVNEDCDAHGCYALHMAVVSDRLAMYDLLVDEMEADTGVLNIAGETPLQLAARLDRRELFYHMLHKERRVRWVYGQRVNYDLNMRGVDGVSRFSSAVSERQSALESIVAHDYREMLNSMPVIALLTAKWRRGARGHYYLTMVSFVAAIVLQTLLAQHRRQGVTGKGPQGGPVLKLSVQSLVLCNANFKVSTPNVAANGTVLGPPTVRFGTGVNNCNVKSQTYGFDQNPFDDESWALEVGVVAFAALFTFIELWDIFVYIRTILQRAYLAEIHREDAPVPPALYPVPGGVLIDDWHRQCLPRLGRTSGQKRRVAPGEAATNPADVAGASAAGESGMRSRWAGALAGVVAGKPSHARLTSIGSVAVAAAAANAARAAGRMAAIRAWLRHAPVLVVSLARNVVHEYVMRQPTVVLIWVWCGLVFAHFQLYVKGFISPTGIDERFVTSLILGWLYLLHFSRGFKFVGHLFIIIMRILAVDVVKWGSVYLVILTGFSIACFLVIRDEFISPLTTLVDQDFSTMGMSMYRLFRHTLGEHVFEEASRNDATDDFTIALLCAFTVLTTLVMMNLLIAMMNDTYLKIAENALENWHMQWAYVIIAMERRAARRSLGSLFFGAWWGVDAAGSATSQHGPGAANASVSGIPPELQYLIINVEEDVATGGGGGVVIGGTVSKAREQKCRDGLRRAVRWMNGVRPPAPPTLTEIDALFDAHKPDVAAMKVSGSKHSRPMRPAIKGGPLAPLPGSEVAVTVAPTAPTKIEDMPCGSCAGDESLATAFGAGGPPPFPGHYCALAVPDVRVLAARVLRVQPSTLAGGSLAKALRAKGAATRRSNSSAGGSGPHSGVSSAAGTPKRAGEREGGSAVFSAASPHDRDLRRESFPLVVA